MVTDPDRIEVMERTIALLARALDPERWEFLVRIAATEANEEMMAARNDEVEWLERLVRL